MPNSRRQFLNRASIALMAAASACRRSGETTGALPPGAPPAFGTAPPVGPEVSADTFAEAEKLVRVELTPAARQMAAGNWRKSLAPVYERRTGPRKLALDAAVAPATRWDPVLPGQPAGPARDRFVRTNAAPTPLPAADRTSPSRRSPQLSRWIEARQLTSERLTRIYLERIGSASTPSCAA